MNPKKLEKDDKTRLQWALEQAESKEKLPEPHGKGLVYVSVYRHGQVVLNAYQALEINGTVDAETVKTKHRQVYGTVLHDSAEGRKLIDATEVPVFVKDRVRHRMSLYV